MNSNNVETIEIVCIGLSMIGGVSFQRQGSIFSGVSVVTLHRSLHMFTKAVIAVLKADYLHLHAMCLCTSWLGIVATKVPKSLMIVTPYPTKRLKEIPASDRSTSDTVGCAQR